jgi:hypothetical protein
MKTQGNRPHVPYRPKCRQCKRPLPIEFETTVRPGTPEEVQRGHLLVFHYTGKTRYGYRNNGVFCTQRCGWRFALAAVKEEPEEANG